MFSKGSSSSMSRATVTPSWVTVGAPYFLSSATLRPLGPSVVPTASASASMPRFRLRAGLLVIRDELRHLASLRRAARRARDLDVAVRSRPAHPRPGGPALGERVGSRVSADISTLAPRSPTLPRSARRPWTRQHRHPTVARGVAVGSVHSRGGAARVSPHGSTARSIDGGVNESPRVARPPSGARHDRAGHRRARACCDGRAGRASDGRLDHGRHRGRADLGRSGLRLRLRLRLRDVQHHRAAARVLRERHGSSAPTSPSDWTVSEDGLTYTLTIREGVKFHDGTPMTVDDVVFSLNRIRDPELGSYVGWMLGNVADIQAPDDQTVVITMSQPDALVEYALASTAAHVVKQGVRRGARRQTTARPSVGSIGTGPFKFVEWVSGDHQTLAPQRRLLGQGQRRTVPRRGHHQDPARADHPRGRPRDGRDRLPPAATSRPTSTRRSRRWRTST